MSKHKLSMVSNIKKKRTKKKKSSKRKQKLNIIDVSVDTTINLGTKASPGNIGYHYQQYSNIFEFIKRIIYKDKKLQKIICIPDIGEGWMQSFLRLHFYKLSSKKYGMKSIKPVDSQVTKNKFIREIKKCSYSRLVPINLQIIVPDIGTHSNIILLDNKKKTIELFEPHGNRGNKSKLESISGAYFKVSKNVKRYFEIYLPEYKYIPPSKYEPKLGLQARLDVYSGMCVTWSLLWLHYRILNPDISQNKLITYLDTKVTKKFLLQYTKFVEVTLKY